MLYDDVYVVIYLLFIVINYINLFVFDDEIQMKNRSTIQTLTFVQTNPDHLYMKLNMPGTMYMQSSTVSVRKKLAPCKIFNWLLNWLLTFKTGTWKWHLAIFLAPTFWEPEQPLNYGQWHLYIMQYVCVNHNIHVQY